MGECDADWQITNCQSFGDGAVLVSLENGDGQTRDLILSIEEAFKLADTLMGIADGNVPVALTFEPILRH